MRFGQAIDEMRAGKKVKRPSWAQYLFAEWEGGKPKKLMVAQGQPSINHAPVQPRAYLPTHDDLFTEEWMIA